MQRIDHVRLKINRAGTHIAEIEAISRTFFDTQPYEIVREEHPTSGDYRYRIHIKREPPPELAVVIGEAIHELRSALDVLVCQLVEANSELVTSDHAFPTFATEKKFKAGYRRRIKGVHKDVAKLLWATKPFPGGNTGLWQIHKLDIRDKHKALIPVFSNYGGVSLNEMMADRMAGIGTRLGVESGELIKQMDTIFIKPADRRPLKNGDVIYVVAKRNRGAIYHDPQFQFQLAFSESGVVDGEPILPTVRQFRGLVESLVEPFIAHLS